RRRHTRFSRDWSSDVCSSDLALLILHSLAQEAIRRGWTVTANPSTFRKDPWNGRRTRVSPGPDLFSIDAGDAPAVIRLRMQQKRSEERRVGYGSKTRE